MTKVKRKGMSAAQLLDIDLQEKIAEQVGHMKDRRVSAVSGFRKILEDHNNK